MALSLSAVLLLAGCQSKKEEEKSAASSDPVKIGINQLAEHPALDAVRKGFEDALKEGGVEAKIDYQNAQGDLNTANTISKKMVSDKSDLILAIATPSAQATKNATSDVPVLFSAVTDPVAAGLVESIEKPGANVTGTSDKTPMKEQLTLITKIDPKVKKVGIIYNTSEANSKTQVDEAKKLAPGLGLEIVEVGINNINEVPQATDSALSKSDALYIITDNTVVSATSVVTTKALEAKKIVIGSEESQVQKGALMTAGISYYELGKQTGKMAIEILKDGKKPADLPVQYQEKLTNIVNKKTIQALGLDPNAEVFKGATVVE